MSKSQSMNPVRKALPPMPDCIAQLPVSEKGYPIPWFVQKTPGEPVDFRVTSSDNLMKALTQKRCWICGQRLGKHIAFVGGPISAMAGYVSEPASHRDCAEWAHKACPFLLLPKSQRSKAALPADVVVDSTQLIDNPGISMMWVTSNYGARGRGGKVQIRMGHPTEVIWYREGRLATEEEVIEAVMASMARIREKHPEQYLTMSRGRIPFGEKAISVVFPE